MSICQYVMSVCQYVSMSPFQYDSISICQYVIMSEHQVSLSMYKYVFPFFNMSIHCMSICHVRYVIPVCQYVSMSIFQYDSISICQYVNMSEHQVSLSRYKYVFPLFNMSIHCMSLCQYVMSGMSFQYVNMSLYVTISISAMLICQYLLICQGKQYVLSRQD